MRFSLLLCLGVFVPVFTTHAAVKPEWPQFRGPGGAAVSESASPPVEFNVSKNLLWKAPVSLGYSSPIVAGERVFLTGGNDGKLETFCLDLRDGRILWRQLAATNNDSKVSGQAVSTPVTDGKF